MLQGFHQIHGWTHKLETTGRTREVPGGRRILWAILRDTILSTDGQHHEYVILGGPQGILRPVATLKRERRSDAESSEMSKSSSRDSVGEGFK
jgi:hypothetical protein